MAPTRRYGLMGSDACRRALRGGPLRNVVN